MKDSSPEPNPTGHEVRTELVTLEVEFRSHRTGLPQPTQKVVYDNYLIVRKNLDFLKSWIDDRLKDILSGKTPEPEKTLAWYWMKNGEESEYFNHQDVVFECFHNFVAFSQWGNTMYNIMATLGRDAGDAQAKDWFTKTMAGDSTSQRVSFPPWNASSWNCFAPFRQRREASQRWRRPTRRPSSDTAYIVSPHTSTSHDRVQWSNPDDFDPSGTNMRPPARTSMKPVFSRWSGEVAIRTDVVRRQRRTQGRAAQQRFRHRVRRRRRSSTAGVRLRRFRAVRLRLPPLPGEPLTVMAFEDLLRKVANERLEFVKVAAANPQKVPLGPSAPRSWSRSVPPPSSTTT